MKILLALLAQTVPSQQAPAPPSDDIVVTGLRDLGDLNEIDSAASPVSRRTLGSGRTGQGAARSRQVFAQSQRFAACAIARAQRREWLRAALDGTINGARQRFAQTRFIQTNASCAPDSRAGADGVAAATRDYDPSYYDRGALYIEAIRRFAPKLDLTRAQTGDAAVQARFDRREIPRARFRMPVDRRYFETAICLVRFEPGLSVRLVRWDAPPAEVARIEAVIVSRARQCVGNARQVYFDPVQFRFYIADAVYRWAVAARAVDTLIPPDGSLDAPAQRR